MGVSVLSTVASVAIGIFWKLIKNEKTNHEKEMAKFENEKHEDKENFREYKRDTAVAIAELYESRNECNSRLDKIEVNQAHITKEHDRNHGPV